MILLEEEEKQYPQKDEEEHSHGIPRRRGDGPVPHRDDVLHSEEHSWG